LQQHNARQLPFPQLYLPVVSSNLHGLYGPVSPDPVNRFGAGGLGSGRVGFVFGPVALINDAVNAVVASAPAALDTLDELAAALGDDADYAATITNALAAKAPLASPALTGNPTAPTQTLGNDSTRVATTEFVKAAIQDISSLNLVLDGGGVE
jgi:hypothetical protein